jgi:hypothetical protein
MHYNHIENIAESIGTAQSILKSLLAQRFTSNSDLIGSNDDKEVLHEYAQSALDKAMSDLSTLSRLMD